MKLKNIDQRYYQLAFLVSLFLYAKFYIGIPHMEWWFVVITISSMQVFQWYFSKIFKVAYDWRSPLISSIAITILLSVTSVQAVLFCTFFTIAGKFLIRAHGKHIFNPNNFSIVLTVLMFPGIAKITPYQWGLDSVSVALLVLLAGIMVSRSVKSYDIALYFYVSYGLSMLLFYYTHLFSGNLLLHLVSIPITLFSFFMITDPRVIPNSTQGRFIFAIICVFIADILYIYTNLTPSFIYALPVVSLLTPFIDSYFGGKNFEWNKPIAS